MLKKTRLRAAAVSAAVALAIVAVMGALAPVAHSDGCDGECPPPQGCGIQQQPGPPGGNFSPQGGDGGCGGTTGSSQGFSQGSGQGQNAGGTGSGPTIGAGGGEKPPPTTGAATFGPTPTATPAIPPPGGTLVFGRGSSVNLSQHSHANVRGHNSNRAGNVNGGPGGNAANHF